MGSTSQTNATSRQSTKCRGCSMWPDFCITLIVEAESEFEWCGGHVRSPCMGWRGDLVLQKWGEPWSLWGLCVPAESSDVRTYVSSGAVGGKQRLIMGRVYPHDLYTFALLHYQGLFAMRSIRQGLTGFWSTVVLSAGELDECILGGWSLGALAILVFTLSVEACARGVRAVFTIDERSLAPYTNHR